jgi:hypothetical protein
MTDQSARIPRAAEQVSRNWFFLCAALSVAPLVFILLATLEARRDWPYWDEIDSAVAFLITLKEGGGIGGFLDRLFAVSNEHRLVVSRLLFALSYWTTGTLNFAVLDWVGISWIVAGCSVIISTGRDQRERWMFALILGLTVFQLEHYENFLWSGSSIDHFLAPSLSLAAVVLLARPGIIFSIGALVAALGATGVLAHGLAVWPSAALCLWMMGQRRNAVVWLGLGLIVLAAYLNGFTLNSEERFPIATWSSVFMVIKYWCSLIGSVPAFGSPVVAPLAGVAGLLAIGFLGFVRGSERRPVEWGMLCYLLLAMAMISVGRAVNWNGELQSRYFILSALLWAILVFMLLRSLARDGVFRKRLVFTAAAVLVVFNVAANIRFHDSAISWIECRNRARTRFAQEGIDGRGPFKLHPNPDRSTEVLNRAEELGVYVMEQASLPRPVPAEAVETSRIAYHIDELTVNRRSLFFRGWAAVNGAKAERGKIEVFLFSDRQQHFFSTVPVRRPDVAAATGHPSWQWAGFRFARRRAALPDGEYGLGLVVESGGSKFFIKTEHRVVLSGYGRGILAGQ